MRNKNVKLVEPCMELKDEFLTMVDEYWASGEQFGGWMFKRGSIKDFSALLKKSKDNAEGKNLPKDRMPSTTSWLIDGDEVVGYSSLRHELNEDLKKRGGHIGYCVRPSERQKGYGSHSTTRI